MKKKIIIIISSVVGALLLSFAVICILCIIVDNNQIKEAKKKEIVYGDFKYAIAIDKPDYKTAYLVGLSDEGKKKDEIVVPFLINGYIIQGFCVDFSYDCDFRTAKTIYLGAINYQCGYMKIGENTTIYGGDHYIYKKVLKTNSKQYVTEHQANIIKEKYKDHNNVFQASVVFDITYYDTSWEYISNAENGKITQVPEFDYKNLDYRFDGWYNGETRWNLATDVVTDNIVLEDKWR